MVLNYSAPLHRLLSSRNVGYALIVKIVLRQSWFDLGKAIKSTLYSLLTTLRWNSLSADWLEISNELLAIEVRVTINHLKDSSVIVLLSNGLYLITLFSAWKYCLSLLVLESCNHTLIWGPLMSRPTICSARLRFEENLELFTPGRPALSLYLGLLMFQGGSIHLS